MSSALFGEQSLSKVAAQFDSAEAARAASEELMVKGSIDASHIRVLEPNDRALDNKLEPERRGIARTLAKSHVTLGVGGLVVGLIVALVLVVTGIAAFSWSPMYTYLVFGFFGAVVGLLAGGLVSLRPDHDRLIAWVKDGTRSGRWFLLVHAKDHDEEQRAKDMLKTMSNDVVATL